jgi:hypothetical protein
MSDCADNKANQDYDIYEEDPTNLWIVILPRFSRTQPDAYLASVSRA